MTFKGGAGSRLPPPPPPGGGLGDLREKIIFKQCKNEATCQILHQVNSLICTPYK